MIIAKAPLRISIGGGGTDLPSYYEQFGSQFISAAIDKYVYIAVHKIFLPDIIIKYSQLERVTNVDDIKHPIVRACLKEAGVHEAVEISSFADIPSGTGLGSSSSFTVALLKALFTFTKRFHSNHEIAEIACDIEINRLGSPIGKQDQFIAALGGITEFDIATNGTVKAAPLALSPSNKTDLEEHLLLFFTGYTRSANDILKEQVDKTEAQKKSGQPDTQGMIENLHFVRELGGQIGTAIKQGDLDEFARLMNVHWEHKKKRSRGMSNGNIDQWYDLARQNGALGGKIIGAGGGGFLMFLADDKRRLRKTMRDAGLQDVPFRFDDLGAQVALKD